ncbi:MAG: S8 family serine peptidase [Bacteroidota bacterium]
MTYPQPSLKQLPIVVLFVVLFPFTGMIAQDKDHHQPPSASLDSLIASFKEEWSLKQDFLTSAMDKDLFNATYKTSDGTLVALNDMGADGTLLYYTTHTNKATMSTKHSPIYPETLTDLGLSGKNMQVGIWDAGVALDTHQEFDERVIHMDDAVIDNHATLVTGTVISTGIEKRAAGVASEAQALCYDWSKDKLEVAEAAANGLLLSNHSYGIKTEWVPDWYFGAYIKVSKDWDAIMHHAPYYLMVAAAGNAQKSRDNEAPVCGSVNDGHDLLIGFTTAKNGLVIAGANTHTDKEDNLSEVHVANYSSFGPTDDGRIKPDLAGDGTSIYTTVAASDDSYGSSMGTSMAAPGVTGALLLLQEYHDKHYGGHMKAATLKGLALHTADDVQAPGPDYKMGWGVINTKKAAAMLQKKDYSSVLQENILRQDETYTFSVVANENEPLTISLSWTDAPGIYVNQGDLNMPTPALTNDLDLRITKNGDTLFPWKLDAKTVNQPAAKGDNRVDPYERIDIPNAQGVYTITITHKGQLIEGMQPYSLLVSGAQLNSCKLEAPETLALSASNNGINISWNTISDENQYEYWFRSTDNTTWSKTTTANSHAKLSGLVLGQRYLFQVRSICSQKLTSDFSPIAAFVFEGYDTVMALNGPLSTEGTLSLTPYPNPAADYLKINPEISEKAPFSIVSTSGITAKSGQVGTQIDIAALSPGMYVLVVQDGNLTRSSRFLKQ